jgi:hypothetical protein
MLPCNQSSRYGAHSSINPQPRSQPKNYQLLLKTHKLTIFFTVAPTDTVAFLKSEALSALQSHAGQQLEGVPKVTDESQFEICRATKERGSVTPGQHVVLDESETIKGTLSNWEVLFVQFRDDSGKPLLLPALVDHANMSRQRQPAASSIYAILR